MDKMLAYFNSTLYLYKKRKIKLFGLDYSISSCLFSNPMLVMLVSYLQMRRNLTPSFSLGCKQGVKEGSLGMLFHSLGLKIT